jgi:hypothetical protein
LAPALAFIAAGLLHPLWIFVPIGLLSYGQGLALPNVTATAVSLAPQNAGVASSVLLQQIIGAACAGDGPLPDRHGPAELRSARSSACLGAAAALALPARGGGTTMRPDRAAPPYRPGTPHARPQPVNLGTPDEPTTAESAATAEFLGDPRVTEVPRALVADPERRHPPTRPRRTRYSRCDRRLATAGESRAHRGLRGGLAYEGDRVRVELAMTYGNP